MCMALPYALPNAESATRDAAEASAAARAVAVLIFRSLMSADKAAAAPNDVLAMPPGRREPRHRPNTSSAPSKDAGTTTQLLSRVLVV